jgi:filamentous hemagglutinin family protein
MLKALFTWLGLFLCTLGYLITPNNPVLAQVTSDDTVNTQVSDDGETAEITGGERAGDNLFHSFQDFSVETGDTASFLNANDIANIFSRVTGGNISNIDGLISANGSANLFLINPAGIVFGEGARLDIGGSFYGSSASSILFEDGEFSAADLENPPLLTINAPIGLGFRDQPGDIVNRSNQGEGLEVSSGKNIGLLGGNVTLEDGLITAPGGLVELGGLSVAGDIAISETGSLEFPEGIDRSNVNLTNDATVDVAADGGGFINVNAKNLTLTEQSELRAGIAEDTGSPDAQAGDININASESVKIIGDTDLNFDELQTGIRNNVGDRSIVRIRENNPDQRSSAIGNGGAINIDTKLLEFEDDGKVSTVSYGTGNAGNVNILAEDILIDLGTIESFSREGAIGNSGNVTINATDQIVLGDNSEIQAQIFNDAQGNVGDIRIDTGSITLNEFSFIQADTNIGQTGEAGVIGDAGSITINAKDSIQLNGKLSLIISQIQDDGIGNAGEIRITAPNLSLSNFSLISTNVKKNSTGSAGNVFINVDNLNITDGAVIDSLTENDFDGGNININANQINLSDGGKIVTSGNSGGDAGSIELNVTDTITINNDNPSSDSPFLEQILQDTALETGIFASSVGSSTGNGGNINIESGVIEFVNNGLITANTQAREGGNITLQTTKDIILNNNSSISAEAFNNANGGNLKIDTEFIIAYPNSNSDILANAEQGNGGNITIDAESVFGIGERSLDPLTNDINASSELNLDGTVNINTSDINPVQGATELPSNTVEPEQIAAQACEADTGRGTANNGLAIAGKGGVTPAPDTPLNSENIISSEQNPAAFAIPEPIETSQGKIQPARGITVTKSGHIVLTAYPTNKAGERIPNLPNCNSY